MAALHSALQSLGPTAFSSVPAEKTKTKEYLQDLFAQAQIILDSVPPPPPENNALLSRSRTNTTTSEASNDSELSSSAARADPLNPSNISLQKEWGRPVKLTPKENPLGMAVYKLGGKDGRGAWFARRSVHEGLGFRKWKLGLQREFPETLEVQGKPGEGNIRGIGGERRVENVIVEGVGTIEVYHLSAQFPGPTTPRDFVTLLITSSSAIVDTGLSSAQQPTVTSEGGTSEKRSARAPRHFMVISKPCVHPDCPLRDGFIRGQYESIEFIQEIPIRPKKPSSASDLLSQASNTQPQEQDPSVERAALVRNAHQRLDQGGSGDEMLDSMQITDHVPLAKNILIEEGRKRGKTISFAESRGYEAKGEAVDNLSQAGFDDSAEQNPVEWIMVTRSDPGGSVPRFMVERGTPSGIVADAGKFVEWASKKDHPVKDDYGEKREGSEVELARSTSKSETLEAFQTNGYLAGLQDEFPVSADSSLTLTNEKLPDEAAPPGGSTTEEGVLSTLANAAMAGVETYAPQALIDRLPQHRTEDASSAAGSSYPIPPPTNTLVSYREETTPLTAISSAASFASAEDHFTDFSSTKSRNSILSSKDKASAPDSPPQDKQLAKLTERKRTLDERLAKTREEATQNKETLTSRGEERIRKAEEKHAREVAKQEARFRKEVSKLEAKRAKDAAKEAERKRRAEDRDEKLRLTRERDEARREAEKLREEREMLREQVGALQRENTALVAKVGKMEMGKTLLGEVQREVEKVGRSRSSSLRKGREGRGTDGTVSGGEGELKDSPS